MRIYYRRACVAVLRTIRSPGVAVETLLYPYHPEPVSAARKTTQVSS